MEDLIYVGILLAIALLAFFVYIVVESIKKIKKTIRDAKDYPTIKNELAKANSQIWNLKYELQKCKNKFDNCKTEKNPYVDVVKLLGEIEYLRKECTRHKATIDQFLMQRPEIEQINYLEKKKLDLSNDIKSQEKELDRLHKAITQKKYELNNLTQLNDQGRIFSEEINRVFYKEFNISSYFDSIADGKLNKAFNKKISFSNFNFSATIHSGEKKYNVSLTNCSCDSFKFSYKHQKVPCKHMVCFAYMLGILQGYHDDCHQKFIETVEDLNGISMEVLVKQETLQQLHKDIKKATEEKEKITKELKELKSYSKRDL